MPKRLLCVITWRLHGKLQTLLATLTLTLLLLDNLRRVETVITSPVGYMIICNGQSSKREIPDLLLYPVVGRIWLLKSLKKPFIHRYGLLRTEGRNADELFLEAFYICSSSIRAHTVYVSSAFSLSLSSRVNRREPGQTKEFLEDESSRTKEFLSRRRAGERPRC